jgi:putative molybdopterin biosynthesis protein
MSQEDFLTVEEAAAWLRVSKNTIRESIRRGQLPAFKVGREWRISRQVVLDYAKRGTAAAEQDDST